MTRFLRVGSQLEDRGKGAGRSGESWPAARCDSTYHGAVVDAQAPPRPASDGLDVAEQSARRNRFSLGLTRRRVIWGVIWIALAIGAVYFLLPQAGELVDSLRTLESIHPGWFAAGVAIVALRYVLAAVSLRAATGRPIPLGPTTLVQVATSFVGRLTPEGVGWLVLNQRFLERWGMERAPALAALAVRILAGGIARLVLIATVAALVGTSLMLEVEFSPWPYLVAIGLGVAVTVLLLAFVFPSAGKRVLAPLLAAARDLLRLIRDPLRGAVLFLSSAALTVAYVLTLATAVMAFDVSFALVHLFAVYLAGTAAASVSPTPGNLGALEVALSAGLATIGVPAGAAVAAVVVYRLLTLPLVPDSSPSATCRPRNISDAQHAARTPELIGPLTRRSGSHRPISNTSVCCETASLGAERRVLGSSPW